MLNKNEDDFIWTNVVGMASSVDFLCIFPFKIQKNIPDLFSTQIPNILGYMSLNAQVMYKKLTNMKKNTNEKVFGERTIWIQFKGLW